MANKILIKNIKSKIVEDNQVVEKKVQINDKNVSIFYIEPLIDKNILSSSILLQINKLKNLDNKYGKGRLIELVKNSILVSSFKETSDENEIINYILSGYVAIVFDTESLCCPLVSVEKRGIEEPPSSKVLKGPREGFVEDIFTNTGLIRKRIKSLDLKIKNLKIGEKSKTIVSVFYIENIARKDIINQVVRIIESIKIDAILDSNYITSFIEGRKLKFFKRVGNTEKPDVFCAKILEGRVGILVDGSPIALTVPFIFLEDLQSAGDYYSSPSSASFSRILRFIGVVISIIFPAIYVSLQSYNYRMLPINFLITLLNSIERLSVPPLLEILLVLFLFEIISEASIRMPNALGMALSIIGALALGNTAVDAGIISAPSIVIVAISSITIHIIPDQLDIIRILRILFTIIGGVVGLYGVFVGIIMLVTYLSSIESFGIPYFVPYAPNISMDKKDGFIMQPLQSMKYRPFMIASKNKKRQETYNDD